MKKIVTIALASAAMAISLSAHATYVFGFDMVKERMVSAHLTCGLTEADSKEKWEGCATIYDSIFSRSIPQAEEILSNLIHEDDLLKFRANDAQGKEVMAPYYTSLAMVCLGLGEASAELMRDFNDAFPTLYQIEPFGAATALNYSRYDALAQKIDAFSDGIFAGCATVDRARIRTLQDGLSEIKSEIMSLLQGNY